MKILFLFVLLLAPQLRAATYSKFVDPCYNKFSFTCADVSPAFKSANSSVKSRIEKGTSTYEEAAKVYVTLMENNSEKMRKLMKEMQGWSNEAKYQLNELMVAFAKESDPMKAAKLLEQKLKKPLWTTIDGSQMKANEYMKTLKEFATLHRENTIAFMGIGRNTGNFLLTDNDVKKLYDDYNSYRKKVASYADPKNEFPEGKPRLWAGTEAAKHKWANALPKPPAPPVVVAAPKKTSAPAPAPVNDAAASELLLENCNLGFDPAIQVEGKAMGKDDTQLCAMLENMDLMHFKDDVLKATAKPTVALYFELLREKAVTQLLHAHRQITGMDMKGVPEQCKNFGNGIRAFAKTPWSKTDVENSKRLADPVAMASAAKKISQLFEYRKLFEAGNTSGKLYKYEDGKITESDPPLYWQPADNCVEGMKKACGKPVKAPDSHELMRNHDITLRMIEADIMSTLAQHPTLRADHDPKSDPLKLASYPTVKAIAGAGSEDEVKRQIGDAQTKASTALAMAMSAYCQKESPTCPAGQKCSHLDPIETKYLQGMVPMLSAKELLRNKPLTDAVLNSQKDSKLFEAFKGFQECANRKIAKSDMHDLGAKLALGTACGIGSGVPGLNSVMIPACGVVLTGAAYAEWDDKRMYLEFVSNCRTSGDLVCSSAEERKAYEAYRKSVRNLASTYVGVALSEAKLFQEVKAFAEALERVKATGEGFVNMTKWVESLQTAKDEAEAKKILEAGKMKFPEIRKILTKT